MLNELARALGEALGQERIYVAFADRTWILDAEGRPAEASTVCRLSARLAAHVFIDSKNVALPLGVSRSLPSRNSMPSTVPIG